MNSLRKRSLESLECNQSKRSKSDEDNVKIELSNRELWQEFSECKTEMIVTRSGRRMFPSLKIVVSGLDSNSIYKIFLKLKYANRSRWKYSGGEWIRNGEQSVSVSEGQYMHPDSPNYGLHWMSKEISFERLKITNQPSSSNVDKILLKTLHMYVPEILIYRIEGELSELIASETIELSKFLCVTAYQNENITNLKIKHNPFAKAFAEPKRRLTNGTTTGQPIRKRQKTDLQFEMSCNPQFVQYKRDPYPCPSTQYDYISYYPPAHYQQSSMAPVTSYYQYGPQGENSFTPFQCSLKLLVWDFKCPNMLAASHLRDATSKAGAVASFSEEKKRPKYSSLDGYQYVFISIAVETLGYFGKEEQLPDAANQRGDPTLQCRGH
ncbi:hypothetical protein ACOME3_005046 [Neoechinorhynchus agilis]